MARNRGGRRHLERAKKNESKNRPGRFFDSGKFPKGPNLEKIQDLEIFKRA